MDSMTEFKLGKSAPKFDDRTLRMARYVRPGVVLPKVPKVHNLSKRTLKAFPDLGMMRNNALGDCTCASMGHIYQTVTAYGGAPWRPSDDDVVNLYNRVNGGVDEGAAMLDVLNEMRHNGLAGKLIHAFLALDPLKHDQVRMAHFLFGGVYIGLNLPMSAQDEKVWAAVTGHGSEPGSWGGHAVNIVDITAKGPVFVTWGRLQPATWAWFDRFCDEAYTVLTEDWLGADKKSPQGFSLATLDADLGRL